MAFYDYVVNVRRQEVVAAALPAPLPDQWLPMSNLDLLAPTINYGVFFCYKNSYRGIAHTVEHLKKSLSHALVFFYPLAGEVVQNRHGEPEILCNNHGVEFTHAYADVEMKHIDFYHPNESVNGKLVPDKKNAVLAVQVTDLKCGGVIIGCNLDHRIVDGHSTTMFFTSWVEIAQSKPLRCLPSFRRSLLHPRRPPQPQQSLDKLYAPLLAASKTQPTADEIDRITGRIYRVRSDEIDRIQSEASSNGPRRSKIESICAFLWQSVAAAAAADDHSKTLRLGITVDGRSALQSALAVDLASYFGNVVSAPYAEARAGDLQKTSLTQATLELHRCVAPALSAEHFLALIDWVEVQRPIPLTMTIMHRDEQKSAAAEAEILVSPLVGFPFVKMDFGWGGPGFGSFSLGGIRSEGEHVTLMSSASGNRDWNVLMQLKTRHLDFIEARAPHVFRPFHFHTKGHNSKL